MRNDKEFWKKFTVSFLAASMTFTTVLGNSAVVLAAEQGIVAEQEAGTEETTAVNFEAADEESIEPVAEGTTEASAQNDVAGAAEAPKTEATGLTDFTSFAPDTKFEIDEVNKSITLGNSDGDHLALYNGLQTKSNDFVLEADVELVSSTEEGKLSAALLFGVGNKKIPTEKWYGANIDTSRKEQNDLFRLFGPGIDTNYDGQKGDIDIQKPLHLKLDVKKDGSFIYSFGNAGTELTRSIQGTIPDWQGGYVGLLSFRTEAKFSNVAFEDRTVAGDTDTTRTDIEGESFKTNLENKSAVGGNWEVREEGLYSNAVDKGDCFLYSQTKSANFVYSTDVTFLRDSGAAALTFRSAGSENHEDCYAVNLDASSKKCKFWRWQDESDYQLIDEKAIEPTADGKYTLKVVAIDSWMMYYVNDVLVASTGDYYLQPGDRGQNTCGKSGYFGLLNWNGEMVFQNTYYTEINGDFNPLADDITVTSSTGTVEAKTQFTPTEPITLQYVRNDAKTVDLKVTPQSKNAAITVKDEDGKVYEGGKNIPVAEGSNYLEITSTVTADNSATATATYRVNVHRRQADGVYYNEPYRGQYHYSVQDGWANDPNGLVYYNGTYHLFYQFYDDTKWGPMHWAHATSKDLINWEEQPIALYPDANGAMFSGCIVADETNSSGLFSSSKGGLVALITADGNGQRIKLAYSEDEGKTWTKVDEIAADWTDDPLLSRDFRDPKVFRWENKWFMVVAGGPLRIYSSDNLTEWKCESTYSKLHTECPDMYPIEASDGTIKWVLSRGGRAYKVGDFKQVDGSWKFIPDEEYKSTDGVMNFGRDSYAAMTYYIQDFGTSANPTLPEIVELNWMNTWDDYCNLVADTVGQQFNGTFNLNLKLGLTEEDGNYLLTQTPIEGYQTLRDEKNATILKDVEVSENNELLKDFSSDCYEIVSTFKPSEDTKKVGFKLRVGGKEATTVLYDLETEMLSIDRSKSGIIISDKFAEVNSQKVTKNADGTIDLHIYVDRSSVEVFTKGDTVTGANQIFPSKGSLGAEVTVEGGAAKADITIYPMNSIWKENTQTPPTHTHEYIYTDNQDGTHTATCRDQDDTFTEKHTYADGTCTLCGAELALPSQNISCRESFTKNENDCDFYLNARNNSNWLSKMTYSSSDESVVTVSSRGKVSIKGAGNAVITITAPAVENKYAETTKQVMITVNPAEENTDRPSVMQKIWEWWLDLFR